MERLAAKAADSSGEIAAGLNLARHGLRIPLGWLLFLAGFLALICGLLIGPRVPIQYQKLVCIGNIQLVGPFGIGLNCDSPEFMWLARDPSGLLLPKSPRQSRPGLIAAAAVLQAPLSFVAPAAGPPQPVGQGIYDPPRITSSFYNDRPAYLAYILLNATILLASFYFLLRVISPQDEAPPLLAASIGILLIANDVTKAFFWSPHTQMFNILVPLLAVYAVGEALRGGLRSRRFSAAMGIGVGLGLTAYPFFVVIPACLLPIALFVLVRNHEGRAKAIANFLLLFGLMAAPSLAWYLLVVSINGEYFHFEAAQGQIVWMAAAWNNGVFLKAWLSHLGELISAIGYQALPPLIFALWVAFNYPWGRSSQHTLVQPIWVAAYVGAAVLGFYTCVGWPEPRLAYAAIPPSLTAIGAVSVAAWHGMNPKARRAFAIGAMLIACFQVVFVIAKEGPWS